MKTESGRAFLAAILESLEDSIVAVDTENRITAWNQAAEELYGYPAAEVLGKSLTQVMAEEDLKAVLGRMEEVRQGGQVVAVVEVAHGRRRSRQALARSVHPGQQHDDYPFTALDWYSRGWLRSGGRS